MTVLGAELARALRQEQGSGWLALRSLSDIFTPLVLVSTLLIMLESDRAYLTSLLPNTWYGPVGSKASLTNYSYLL